MMVGKVLADKTIAVVSNLHAHLPSSFARALNLRCPLLPLLALQEAIVNIPAPFDLDLYNQAVIAAAASPAVW